MKRDSIQNGRLRKTPLFIFSLPRSGSTLLQKVLSTNSQVSTTAETWFLLHLLQARRADDIVAIYNHRNAVLAVNEFLARSAGDDCYRQETASYIINLYSRLFPGDGRYALDKTPRYHMYAKQIVELFANDAKYIVLWRNPLSIVSSIVETWKAGKWELATHFVDLYLGVEGMLAAGKVGAAHICHVRYEDLVREPEATLDVIGRYLSIDIQVPDGELATISTNLQGSMGDKNLKNYEAISADSFDNWGATFSTATRKRWARNYISFLREVELPNYFYDLDLLTSQLDSQANGTFAEAIADSFHWWKTITYSMLEGPQFKSKFSKRYDFRKFMAKR